MVPSHLEMGTKEPEKLTLLLRKESPRAVEQGEIAQNEEEFKERGERGRALSWGRNKENVAQMKHRK